MFESITQEFVFIMRKHCYRNGTEGGRPVLVITVNSGTYWTAGSNGSGNISKSVFKDQ